MDETSRACYSLKLTCKNFSISIEEGTQGYEAVSILTFECEMRTIPAF